jgi:hypothetical protein
VAGALGLVDPSATPRKTLFAFEQSNAALPVGKAVPLYGAAFASLPCSACPPGASNSLVVTP